MYAFLENLHLLTNNGSVIKRKMQVQFESNSNQIQINFLLLK